MILRYIHKGPRDLNPVKLKKMKQQPKMEMVPLRLTKAAAAMCVGIGSFSDPMEAQGLAHLLEHMLFMGSTKFLFENEILQKIGSRAQDKNGSGTKSNSK